MKNLIIIMAFMVAALTVSAIPKVADYVVTQNGTEYFTKVRNSMSSNYLIGVKQGGEKFKIDKQEIVAYRKDGVVFEMKSLIENGLPCEECGFMELLSVRNGVKIYKYVDIDFNGNSIPEIYVFRGDKYVIPIMNQNCR